MIGQILGFTPTHKVTCEACGRPFTSGEGVAILVPNVEALDDNGDPRSAYWAQHAERTAWYCSEACRLLRPYSGAGTGDTAHRWQVRFAYAGH